MPMIGRGDDDGINALVVEEATEIAVELHARSNELSGCLETRLISVSDGGHLRIGQSMEVASVNSPDQAKADDADANAFVRAEHALGAQGRYRGSRRCHLLD